MRDSIHRAYMSILPANVELPSMETICCSHNLPDANALTEVFHVDSRDFDSFQATRENENLHELHRIAETPELVEYTRFSYPVNNALHVYNKQKSDIPAIMNPVRNSDMHLAATIENQLHGFVAKTPFIVYTGTRHSPIHNSVNIGGYYHAQLPAFVSTTTNFDTARFFAAHDHETDHSGIHRDILSGSKHILKLHIVPGTNIGSVKHFARFETEKEMLLNRGYNIMINPIPTKATDSYTKKSAYVWDTWLTNRTPKQIK